MRGLLRAASMPFTVPARYHFWSALLIVAFTGLVMDAQVRDRWDFAGGELRRDVMDRWGAPIDQPAPSALFVESGSVFSTLETLPFDAQSVHVAARMSYRKRGLVYFTGFEFAFEGRYRLTNPTPRPIDVVFVFPVQAERNRILLSDLRFAVDGEPEATKLHAGRDKLVWTGRVEPHDTVPFEIGFKGQGLDRFSYVLDPALPARSVDLTLEVAGGETHDYPPGVVPAHVVEAGDGRVSLSWRFDALESGVPIGALLPSETSYDAVIARMARRAWAPFALLFVTLALLARAHRRTVPRHDAWLAAALYAFFFVLLPYLAAYTSFQVAYLLTVAIVGTLLLVSVERISGAPRPVAGGLIVALLVVPSAAVVFEEHTGLIYSLEILAGLVVLTVLLGKAQFRTLVEDVARGPAPSGKENVDANT